MTQSLGSRLARGAALMLILRWLSRAMGLVSAMVLARLLTPEDFGLVAVAIAVTHLFEIVLDTSAETSLISRRSYDADEWNTAWTMRVLSGALIALGMLGGGLVAVEVYDDDRYALIFWVLALSSLIRGFENIGVIGFRLDMRFERDARYLLICKLASVVGSMTFALIFRSYESILAATLAAAVFQVAYSYRAHEFRPRFSLKVWRIFLGFSAWMLALNLSKYLLESVDKLILGRVVSARVLGFYKMSSELASLPVSEVVFPIARALNVGFASVREDRQRFGRLLTDALGMVSLFAFPFTLGMAVTAEELVAVILGGQWDGVVPYLKIFALYYLLHSISHYFGTAMIVMGKVRLYAGFVGLVASFAVASAWGLSAGRDPLLVFALAKLAAAMVITMLLWFAQIRAGLIAIGALIAVVWRPALASLVMFAAVHFISWPIENILLRLCAKAGAGALVFLAILLLLWAFSGRPRSAEHVLIDAIRRRLGAVPA